MTESEPSATKAPTALYHGACPICGTEIRHYQAYCARNDIGIAWSDISSGVVSSALDASGLDREDAKRRMTAIDADGTLHRGVDAFILLWGAMPRYRRLAHFVQLPVIYRVANFVYDRILAPLLYKWNRKAGR